MITKKEIRAIAKKHGIRIDEISQSGKREFAIDNFGRKVQTDDATYLVYFTGTTAAGCEEYRTIEVSADDPDEVFATTESTDQFFGVFACKCAALQPGIREYEYGDPTGTVLKETHKSQFWTRFKQLTFGRIWTR